MYFPIATEALKTGIKKMTRRIVEKWGKTYTNNITDRMNTGSWIRAQTGYATATQFGWVKVTNMYQEKFGDMPLEDVRREGFPEYSLSQFKELSCFAGCNDDTLMWVLELEFMSK
jgi:hypothetical protein